jgi:large subunit ribosomal protein L24
MSARETVRMKIEIRKGDLVRVVKGRDRDAFRSRTSRVLSVDPIKGTVTVEHAHMIKRHTRPNPAKNIKGGIVEREAPIHISNVRLVCAACNRPARIGHKVEWGTEKVTRKDGATVERRKIVAKDRICRRCGTVLGA